MAENLGAIRYDIEVETASMLKAESIVDKSISNQVKSFDAADKAIRRFEAAQKSAGKTINSLGQVIDANGNILTKQTQQYRTLASEAEKSFGRARQSAQNSFVAASSTADLLKKNLESMADQSLKKLNNSFDDMQTRTVSATPKVSKVASAVSNAGRAANKSSFQMTNLSYQIQDVAVQAQMGTSAAIIFAQQFPQMMVGMGAAAGAIGAVVAILGGLITAMSNTKTTAQMLEKAVDQVKATMTLGADGVVNYTDELKELNKVSQQLAKIKLAEAILNQNEVIKNSAKAIVESAEATSKAYKSTFSELRNLTESVAKDIGGDMNDVAEAIRGGQNIGTAGSYLNRDLDRIAKQFKITRSEALELGLAMSDVIKKGDAVSIKSLQNVTEDLAEAYGYSNDKITKLASGMVKYFIASNQATDGVNELRMALFGKGQAIDEDTSLTADATKAATSMTLSLIEQKVALEQGERAALSFRLQLSGVSEAEKQHILSLHDANEVTKKNKEETDEATAANERYEASVRKKTESDLDWFEQQEQWLKDQNKQKTATLTTQVQSIGLTPEAEIQARFDKELELLKQAEEQKIEIEGTYAERRVQLEKERQESIRGLQSETSEFMENAFGNLETQIAGTMAQVIVGAKDGKEAMAALANTILTQVIGAVVQWGIAEVTKLFTVESAEKSMQAANAAATTASVSAQVGMNTALAAQNAFMATAAIPFVGPALAPAAAAAAGAASAAIGASAIPLAPLAGAREFGGPVSQGMYRVNETGTPEIYSQGGKDYLMNTKNANITPLDKAGGGSQMPQIIVNNNSPEKAYVTYDEVTRIAKVQIGKEAKLASQGRGNMLKGLSSGTNVRNKANRG